MPILVLLMFLSSGNFCPECFIDHVVFSEGQPESIVQDIENMVRSYVDKVWLMQTSIEVTMTLTYCA